MTATLTFQDIRQFAVYFDQKHGAREPTDLDYRTINFIREHGQTAGDVNEYFIDKYLPSNHSVTALLDCYKGIPTPIIFDLNAASKVILGKLNQIPRESREELVYFKKLLEVVFKSCFTQLKIEDKIKITQQFEEFPEIFSKLDAIIQISDINLKEKELTKVRHELMGAFPLEEQLQLAIEFLNISSQIHLLKDESWEGCTLRCSLIRNISILEYYGSIALFSVLIAGIKNLRLTQMKDFFRDGVVVFFVSMFVLVVYEVCLTKITGTILYGYRWYYDLKARDAQNIHQRIDHIITLHHERVNKKDPTDGLIHKWRDRALAVIIPSAQ